MATAPRLGGARSCRPASGRALLRSVLVDVLRAAAKMIGDALRVEVRRGAVERRGRGRYAAAPERAPGAGSGA